MNTQEKIQKLLSEREWAYDALEDLVRRHALGKAAIANQGHHLEKQLEFLHDHCNVSAGDVLTYLSENVDPDEEELQFVVTFHPEQWVGHRGKDIVPAKALGKRTFKVTRTDLLNREPRSESADELKHHRNAPKWVKEWDGPFELDWVQETK